MYNVLFSNKAEQQLKKLPQSIKNRISSIIERIIIRPFHFIKRKQGTSYYILRAGNYRLVLRIKQKSSLIIIIEIGHRKNIYK